MLKVYLDQNKWIDLSKAAYGKPGGETFSDALVTAEYSSLTHNASFVLTEARYIETSRRRDRGSRERLGKLMAKLSKFDTLAPPSVVVPWEIDCSLANLTGSPQPPTPKLFGSGVAHCFGADGPSFTLDDVPGMPPGTREKYEQLANDVIEHAMLYGEHAHMPEEWRETLHQNEHGERYAQYETDLAARIVDEKFGTRGRIERVMLATEMKDIIEPLNRGLSKAGISIDDFFSQTREEMTAFMHSLPSRRVAYEMRLARHRNPQKKWTATDLNDVGALSVAVPYCDIVITESHWVHALKTMAKLDKVFQTRIESGTEMLMAALAEGWQVRAEGAG